MLQNVFISLLHVLQNICYFWLDFHPFILFGMISKKLKKNDEKLLSFSHREKDRV